MKFVGIKEYANARGLTYTTVYDLCRDGTLPSVRIGRRHKIEIEGADRYFNEQIAARQEKRQKMKQPIILSARASNQITGNYLTQLNSMLKGAVMS